MTRTRTCRKRNAKDLGPRPMPSSPANNNNYEKVHNSSLMVKRNLLPLWSVCGSRRVGGVGGTELWDDGCNWSVATLRALSVLDDDWTMAADAAAAAVAADRDEDDAKPFTAAAATLPAPKHCTQRVTESLPLDTITANVCLAKQISTSRSDQKISTSHGGPRTQCLPLEVIDWSIT